MLSLFRQHFDLRIRLRVEKVGPATANDVVENVKIVRLTAGWHEVALVSLRSLQGILIRIDSNDVKLLSA